MLLYCGENRLWSCNLPFNAVDAIAVYKRFMFRYRFYDIQKALNALNNLYYVSIFPSKVNICGRDEWMTF